MSMVVAPATIIRNNSFSRADNVGWPQRPDQLHRRVAERVSLDTHALGVASIYRRLLQREPETALG